MLFKRHYDKSEKGQSQTQKNTGKTYICERTLSQIYKDLLQLNNKKITAQNMGKTFEHFSREDM